MSKHSQRIIVAIIFSAIAISLKGCFSGEKPKNTASSHTFPSLPADQQAVYLTNASEELTEKLRQKLTVHFPHAHVKQSTKRSSQYVMPVENLLALGGPKGKNLHDIVSQNVFNGPFRVQWPLLAGRLSTPADAIWKPFFGVKFSNPKLGIVRSQFLDNRTDRFETEASYEANVVFGNFHGGFHSTQTIRWEKQEDRWIITNWRQKSVELIFTQAQLFRDVTSSWIPLQQTRAITNRSPQDDLLIKAVAGEFDLNSQSQAFKWFHEWRSSAQYPAVSVVDFDNDGWDDLFITGNLSQNLMLRNEQGKFKDVTQEIGLNLSPGKTNCGLFADFDNDGDVDALIGRSTEPSLYYENNDGHFDLHQDISGGLQHCRFISSGALADINQDGFLDAYLSTYCVHGEPAADWIRQVVDPKYVQPFFDHLRSNRNHMLDRVGPPNILLANHSGKLKVAEIESPLLQWRNSYQPYWFDYDEDGDPDLYLCNDFSPDVMLRNDTKQGSFQFRFVDVTKEVFGGALQGFGMGVSAGDFDSDGDLDLYVSNMYSKAGNRIFKRLKQVSQASRIAASGNFLFRNQGQSFEQIAHPKQGMHVAKVGWSFGGQFADFNNDGDLDLYVPSGLFTPPERVAGQGDL